MSDPLRDDTAALALLLKRLAAKECDTLALRAMVEEASEAGARRALAQIGLADNKAGGDIHELRQLLTAWRDMRRTVRHTLVSWLVKLMISALLIGVMLELRLGRAFGLGGN